ncbi:hypothetical protein Tco_1046030 [Tanacetum coccineum]
MGMDTIQLEDAVSTISGEYLLEFTSEYGIPEGLHPEFPGPKDTIIDFPEGKVSVYMKFFEFANYRIPISQFLFDILGYYQIHLSQLSVIGAAKVSHFEITCRVLNIIPVLSLFRVFYIPSYHLGWMSFSKRPGKNTPQCYTKPLDSLKNWNNCFFWVDEKVFPTVMAWRTEMDLLNLISALNPAKVKTWTRPRTAHEVPLLTATVSRVIEMEDPVATSTSSETPSVMKKSPLDFSSEDPPPMITKKGETKDQTPVVASQEVPSTENTATAEVILELNLEKETTTKEPPVNKRRHKRDQRYSWGKSLAAIGLGPEPPSHTTVQQSVSNPDPLSYAEPQPIPEQDVAQSSKIAAVVADPYFENRVTRKYIPARVGRNQRLRPGHLRSMPGPGGSYSTARQVSILKAQVTGEERIKSAFEEFKKYKDDKVEQRCAEMDAHLDKLSVDFDEELYPHMLTAIAGHRWVIGHGLHLAVMKCAESLEIRRAFADVVSARLAKRMSKGLRYGIEHGKASRDLVDVEAYDLEANRKFVKALQDLKDLKYPMVDELERLKDALVELIMASLHLKSNTGEDASQWIHDLCSSSLQLKIPIYPEKKKCRVVCRTHRISSAHHPILDCIPVSAPTIVPQGLAILVADAATQTEAANKEEELHLRPQ